MMYREGQRMAALHFLCQEDDSMQHSGGVRDRMPDPSMHVKPTYENENG